MKYTKAQFLKDVATELRAIKKHASKSEIGRLDLSWLEPNIRTGCIYGQMTGECRSERGSRLITLCCKRFVTTGFSANMTSLLKNVNGTKSEDATSVNYLSSVEAYILWNKAKLKNVIAYLKGETKTIDL